MTDLRETKRRISALLYLMEDETLGDIGLGGDRTKLTPVQLVRVYHKLAQLQNQQDSQVFGKETADMAGMQLELLSRFFFKQAWWEVSSDAAATFKKPMSQITAKDIARVHWGMKTDNE